MSVKIKDYVTRDRKVLMQTFNTSPKPESMLQNQRLLLEVLCDTRRALVELLFRTEWLKKAAPLKDVKMENVVNPTAKPLSKQKEKKLPFEKRVGVISERANRNNISTEEEEETF